MRVPILLLPLVWTTVLIASEVTNVTFEQALDGSKQVAVSYDLAGDTSQVAIDLSLDGGLTYIDVSTQASGAVGTGIAPGSHSIALDLANLGSPASMNARFRIRAVVDPIIDDAVIVVDEQDTAVLLVEDGSVVFQLADPASSPFETGDILVGTPEHPFLRRVLAVSQGGDLLTVVTEPAALADAVHRGELYESFDFFGGEDGLAGFAPTYLAPGVSAARTEGQLILDGVVLFDGSVGGTPVLVTIPDGSVAFTPGFELSAEFADDVLAVLRLVAMGTLDFDCSLRIESEGGLLYGEEILLAHYEKRKMYFIGHVPVLMRVDLDFKAGFEAGLADEMAVQSGFDSVTEIGVGAEYNAVEGWSPVFDRGTDMSPRPFEWEFEGSLHARGFVRPEVSVTFYEVAGPHLDVEPYLEYTGQLTDLPGWHTELVGGVDGHLGFAVQIFDWLVADYVWSPELWHVVLAEDSGVFNLPPTADFVVDPTSGNLSTVFQMDASASSDEETPAGDLELRWDWEDDGSYDTPWSFDRIANHQYGSAGVRTVRLQVRDEGGLTAETTRELLVVPTSPFEIDWVAVPADQFSMGGGYATPVHQVVLTNDFALSRTEVTNGQYVQAAQWALDHGLAIVSQDSLLSHGALLLDLASPYCEITFAGGLFGLRMAPGVGDYGYDGGDFDPTNHPVKMVTWYGAACFCDWLSLMDGRAPYYDGAWSEIPSLRNPYAAEGCRLPTEAEWEHASRWNDGRTYSWGNASAEPCQQANYDLCLGWSMPVGSYPEGISELGLLDMTGNVMEWCNDWYANYTSGTVTNPVGPNGSPHGRIHRGGGWFDNGTVIRSYYRSSIPPGNTTSHSGFRLCCMLP